MWRPSFYLQLCLITTTAIFHQAHSLPQQPPDHSLIDTCPTNTTALTASFSGSSYMWQCYQNRYLPFNYLNCADARAKLVADPQISGKRIKWLSPNKGDYKIYKSSNGKCNIAIGTNTPMVQANFMGDTVLSQLQILYCICVDEGGEWYLPTVDTAARLGWYVRVWNPDGYLDGNGDGGGEMDLGGGGSVDVS